MDQTIRDYIEQERCLLCGSVALRWGELEEKKVGDVVRDFTCSSCGKSWREHFTLTEIKELPDGLEELRKFDEEHGP